MRGGFVGTRQPSKPNPQMEVLGFELQYVASSPYPTYGTLCDARYDPGLNWLMSGTMAKTWSCVVSRRTAESADAGVPPSSVNPMYLILTPLSTPEALTWLKYASAPVPAAEKSDAVPRPPTTIVFTAGCAPPEFEPPPVVDADPHAAISEVATTQTAPQPDFGVQRHSNPQRSVPVAIGADTELSWSPSVAVDIVVTIRRCGHYIALTRRETSASGQMRPPARESRPGGGPEARHGRQSCWVHGARSPSADRTSSRRSVARRLVGYPPLRHRSRARAGSPPTDHPIVQTMDRLGALGMALPRLGLAGSSRDQFPLPSLPREWWAHRAGRGTLRTHLTGFD